MKESYPLPMEMTSPGFFESVTRKMTKNWEEGKKGRGSFRTVPLRLGRMAGLPAHARSDRSELSELNARPRNPQTEDARARRSSRRSTRMSAPWS